MGARRGGARTERSYTGGALAAFDIMGNVITDCVSSLRVCVSALLSPVGVRGVGVGGVVRDVW